MPYPPNQVEEWAEPAWDAFYKDDPKTPKWAEFGGSAKEKQIQIAHDAATRGASGGNEIEIAYEAAYQKWLAAQVRATNPLPEEKPAKATKK